MKKRQLKKLAVRDARRGKLGSQYLRMWLKRRYKRAARCMTYGSALLERLHGSDCYAHIGEGVSEYITYQGSRKR